MALVPSGIIVGYVGTHGSLPTGGWSRKTALDARYVRCPTAGSDADLTTAFGAATHDHGSPGIGSHTHTVTLNNLVAQRRNNTGVTTTVSTTHSHSSFSSASSTVTLAAATNDYARIETIFIESDGTPTGFLTDTIGMFRTDSLPTDWARVNGNGYLKGAAAAANGSATQTGANTHTHTATAHSHASTNSPNGTAGAAVDASAVTTLASVAHYHQITLSNATVSVDTSSVEPSFRKINFIRNNGSLNYPNKIVAFFNGANGSVPTDWARLTDYDDRFLKGANADGESDVSTGGSTSTHTHTQTHNHTASDGGTVGSVLADDTLIIRGGALGHADNHNHGTTVSSDTTATNASSSEAHLPLYRKLILIEWTDPSAPTLRTRTLTGVGL